MSKDTKRLLVTAPLGVGGITSMMINLQRNIDREKLNFDYLVVHDRHEPSEDIVKEMGSKKIIASADFLKSRGLREVVRWFKLYRVFKDNNIKVFHMNGGPASDTMMVLIAKLAGVKYVTFHSHTAGAATYKNKFTVVLSKLWKPFMTRFVDAFWACSSLAAEYSFPKDVVAQKKYRFLPNGVNLEKFEYNEETRNEMRRELGLENKLVIGHAGRFSIEKNHSFLIDVFDEISKRCSDAVLLLYGVGDTFDQVKEKVERLGLSDKVMFMGASDHIERAYMAFDVFVMPSFCEGMPVSGVEAQVAGLPVVFSDTITREVAVTDGVNYVSLSAGAKKWADKIMDLRDFKRYSRYDELKKAGFDEKDISDFFQNYYLDIFEKIS